VRFMARRIQRHRRVGANRFVLAGGGADDRRTVRVGALAEKRTISTPAATARGSISSFASRKRAWYSRLAQRGDPSSDSPCSFVRRQRGTADVQHVIVVGCRRG
jgi:hypothetical protein